MSAKICLILKVDWFDLPRHYQEYKKLGGQKSENEYTNNLEIFFVETLDVFIHGNCIKHDSREEAMNAVMVKAKISVKELQLIFDSVDNITSYT